MEGYWKPTGNARKIINPDTGVEIGTKKTLVFYRGQWYDKIKIKTCWVMHEYELSKVSPSSNQVSDHTTLLIIIMNIYGGYAFLFMIYE